MLPLVSFYTGGLDESLTVPLFIPPPLLQSIWLERQGALQYLCAFLCVPWFTLSLKNGWPTRF